MGYLLTLFQLPGSNETGWHGCESVHPVQTLFHSTKQFSSTKFTCNLVLFYALFEDPIEVTLPPRGTYNYIILTLSSRYNFHSKFCEFRTLVNILKGDTNSDVHTARSCQTRLSSLAKIYWLIVTNSCIFWTYVWRPTEFSTHNCWSVPKQRIEEPVKGHT